MGDNIMKTFKKYNLFEWVLLKFMKFFGKFIDEEILQKMSNETTYKYIEVLEQAFKSSNSHLEYIENIVPPYIMDVWKEQSKFLHLYEDVLHGIGVENIDIKELRPPATPEQLQRLKVGMIKSVKKSRVQKKGVSHKKK